VEDRQEAAPQEEEARLEVAPQEEEARPEVEDRQAAAPQEEELRLEAAPQEEEGRLEEEPVQDSTRHAPPTRLAVQTSRVRNTTHICLRDSASQQLQAALREEEARPEEVHPEVAPKEDLRQVKCWLQACKAAWSRRCHSVLGWRLPQQPCLCLPR